MFEALAAANVWPVRILPPGRDRVLLAEVPEGLERMQPNPLAHRTGGPPVVGAEQRHKGVVEFRPRNRVGSWHERMAAIHPRLKFDAKPVAWLQSDPAVAEVLGIEAVPSQSTWSRFFGAFTQRSCYMRTAIRRAWRWAIRGAD